MIVGLTLSACGADGSDGQRPAESSAVAEAGRVDAGSESSLGSYSSLEELLAYERVEEINATQAGLQLCEDIWGKPGDILEALGKEGADELPESWTGLPIKGVRDAGGSSETHEASVQFQGFDTSDTDNGYDFECSIYTKWNLVPEGESGSLLSLSLNSEGREGRAPGEPGDHRYFYHTSKNIDFVVWMVPGGIDGVDISDSNGAEYFDQVADRLPPATFSHYSN